MAALKNLFANEGKSLEFQAQDGSTPIRCYPKIKNFSFPDGIWVDYIDYNITLEASEMFSAYSQEDYSIGNDFFYSGPASGDKLFLTDATETWSIDEGESYNLDNPRSYRISHNVSAVGREVYNANGKYCSGWEQARKWVVSHIGSDTSFMYATSGANIPQYFNTYNYIKTENTDEYGGSYSINENWVLNSGAVIEEFSVSTNTRANDALPSVNIEGRITGLETRTGNTVTTTKYSAAETKFNQLYTGYPTNAIYTRARTYSPYSGLNPTPMNMTIGRNPIGGTISYNCEYNNRATTYVVGSLYEDLSIDFDNASDIYGSISVLGRVAGPVLQDLNTVSEKRCTMAMNVVMPTYSGAAPVTLAGITALFGESPKSSVDVIFNGFYDYLAVNYTDYYKVSDTERWSPLTGQYSRSVGFTYQ